VSPTLIKAGLKIICYARDCPGFKELFWIIVLMGPEVYFFSETNLDSMNFLEK